LILKFNLLWSGYEVDVSGSRSQGSVESACLVRMLKTIGSEPGRLSHRRKKWKIWHATAVDDDSAGKLTSTCEEG
jgi:hypothetical protein